VNGALEKAGDTDTFAFKAEAGRWIVLDLQGYALGSQMDPAMKLLDGHGVEVAMNHDTHNLDPLIACEVKKTGTYLVQIMAFVHPPAADVTLKGSAAHVYRLTITDQPYARAAWPPAVQRESNKGIQPLPSREEGLNAPATNLKLLGWNFGAKMEGPEISVNSTKAIASDDVMAVPTANGEPVFAAVVDSPVTSEVEFNNETPKARRIMLPGTVCGHIETPRDEDRFVFTAKKGENWEFRVRAAALHSPLDAWLRIEDKQGKVLQQDDNSGEGNFDPSLKWKVPADGDYVLAIGDLFSRGGWEFVYALEAAPPRLRVTAPLAANAFKLEAGRTVDVKLNAKVSGEFKGRLQTRVEGLPHGVTSKETDVPAKGGEVKLTLSAAADVASASQPLEVVITTSAPDAPQAWRAAFDLRGVEPRGDRLVNEDSRVWLTVVGKAAEEKPAAAPNSAPSSLEKK